MFKSLSNSLARRLEGLQQSTHTTSSCEMLTKDFITGVLGSEALQFVKDIFFLPTRELVITTTHKALAAELIIRKDALSEYLAEKGEKVGSIRIS
jgi:hypothetical protein